MARPSPKRQLSFQERQVEFHALGPDFVVDNASALARPELGWGAGMHYGRKQAVWVREGRVAFVGPQDGLPSSAHAAPRFDAEHRAVLPAFVDCHTHIVYAGDRTEDFCLRGKGVSYASIAAQGGGIQTTVSHTRAASKEELVKSARSHLLRRALQGVLTTEIKSGYGLSVQDELKMLEAIEALRLEGWDVEATLLAAHATPPEMDRKSWLQIVATELAPTVVERKLARFIDVFIEQGAFTPEEGRSMFEAAPQLTPKIHADQLSFSGGAELAAQVKAASADHLEYISEAGIAALAKARTVGVLLPGALLHLAQQAPDLGPKLTAAGVEVAVSTDANPGSSPTHNLGLMATLSVTQLGLTADQALRACTLGAARALRRPELGHMEVGALGRFVVLEHADPRAWVSAFGEPMVAAVVTSDSVAAE